MFQATAIQRNFTWGFHWIMLWTYLSLNLQETTRTNNIKGYTEIMISHMKYRKGNWGNEIEADFVSTLHTNHSYPLIKILLLNKVQTIKVNLSINYNKWTELEHLVFIPQIHVIQISQFTVLLQLKKQTQSRVEHQFCLFFTI